jgi:hypothetical protein
MGGELVEGTSVALVRIRTGVFVTFSAPLLIPPFAGGGRSSGSFSFIVTAKKIASAKPSPHNETMMI